MKKMHVKKIIVVSLVTLALAGTAAIPGYAANRSKFTGKVSIGNGVSLNANIQGEGPCSVVFDSGYGDGIYLSGDSSGNKAWEKVQPEIAKKAETVTYDRTGIGLSDDVTNRPSLSESDIQTVLNGGSLPYNPNEFETGTGKTSIDRAKDLHSLLHNAGVKGPYILVPHSFAMLTAVEFAKLYPNEIGGIVSVDGTWDTAERDMYPWLKKEMPETADQIYRSQFSAQDGTLSEVIMSEIQAQNAGDVLRNVPFTVLHPSDEGYGASYQAICDNAMKNWLKWSDRSKEILVPNSKHYVMTDQPQYVIDAVEDMINQVTKK